MKNLLIIVAMMLMFLYGRSYGHSEGFKQGFGTGIQTEQAAQKEFVHRSIVANITYCESRDIHDRTSWAGAYGRAQFMERTFNWMKGLARKPDLEWEDEDDQMWLLDWAIRNGYGSHWQTCYRQAVAKTSQVWLAQL